MKAGLDLGAEAHMNRPNISFTRTESDPTASTALDNLRVRATVHKMILNGQIHAESIVTLCRSSTMTC